MKRRIFNWKQKILLNLLTAINKRKCSRLKIFKLSFLLSQKINFYDFVPYKYGPYSFEMDKDLRMFSNIGLIDMDEALIYINHKLIKSLSIKTNYEYEIYDIVNKFSDEDEKDLINFVYKAYPFYTKNSVYVKDRKSKVDEYSTPIAIYTIGYQNLSIDLFIKVLIEKNIKVVLDIRNKPLSYKYGFNYLWMKKNLPKFNIEYINIPGLGIEEKYRKMLSCEKLWEYYSNLLNTKRELFNKVCQIIISKPSVLMCYEISPQNCHRLKLAEKVQALTNLSIVDFNYGTKKWKELNY